MTSYKEKLVKFVKLKGKHIRKFGFIYADHKDYENIRSWSEEKCREIYNRILTRIIYKGEYGLVEYTCPWCIFNNFYCKECYYGNRYGICLNPNSAYKKYNITKVKVYFSNKLYRDIIKKTNLYILCLAKKFN